MHRPHAMPWLVVLFFLSVTLQAAVGLEACAANGGAITSAAGSCADIGDNMAATATNSIIQGRVDLLAGVELTVHPDSDVAKRGYGEWMVVPDGGCGQEELDALVEKMPDNTRVVIRGHPEKGGLCFFVMEGTREGVLQKLAMHRWSKPPKVETDTAMYLDIQHVQESDQAEHEANADVPWGLERIQSRVGTGTSPGKDVDVYVMDTGIRTTHQEFNGRAVPELETFGEEPKWCPEKDTECAADDNGHGTFCAGIVGGRTVGVAPKAKLHAVKVLDGGVGTAKSLYVAFDKLLSKPLTSCTTIFSVSLTVAGGCHGLWTAYKETFDRGVTLVLAGGNDRQQNTGWSATRFATIVAATDRSDKVLKHFGHCDMLAPGINIKSAWSGSDSDVAEMSGTSAAAPHVAGAAAILLSEAKKRGLKFADGFVKKKKKGKGVWRGDMGSVKKALLLLGKNLKPSSNWWQTPLLQIGNSESSEIWTDDELVTDYGLWKTTRGKNFPKFPANEEKLKLVLR